MAALAREEPDRIPVFEWSINEKIMHHIFPGCGPFDFEELMDLDGVTVYADEKKQWLDKHTYKDEWGITFAKTEEDYPISIDFPLKDPEKADALAIPDPCAPHRFESLKKAVARFKGKRAIIFRLRDAYSMPRYLRGMENIMMDLILNPELVRYLVDVSIDYHIRMAYRAMELGADVFWSSDDYCDNRGPVMGIELWHTFILPGLKRLVAAVEREGYRFIKHNDGNINTILDDMVDAGISCIDPIDAEAGMNLSSIKLKYGHRIAIKGGVPVTSALSLGSEEDVVRETKRCIREGGSGGGYILSSSSDIIASVKPENFKAMVETVRLFGTYPLDMDLLLE